MTHETQGGNKPHMTLPNGDIIREGDYAVTRNRKKVGPMVPNTHLISKYTHPWAIPVGETYRENGLWFYGDEQSPRDLIAKWHPVEHEQEPVAEEHLDIHIGPPDSAGAGFREVIVPKPAKRRKWWIVDGKAFDSARQAKIAFPGSTPIKVKECKK